MPLYRALLVTMPFAPLERPALGISEIQPGVESLSNHILQLMGKGCTVLDAVQMLKWSQEIGIRAHWNLLFGTPGETADDIRATLADIDTIDFLDPPTACEPIFLDRFSPCFNEQGPVLFPLSVERVASCA